MTELEEAISRLGEVEYQLRALQDINSRIPHEPWVLMRSLADDVEKVRNFLNRVQGRV